MPDHEGHKGLYLFTCNYVRSRNARLLLVSMTWLLSHHITSAEPWCEEGKPGQLGGLPGKAVQRCLQVSEVELLPTSCIPLAALWTQEETLPVGCVETSAGWESHQRCLSWFRAFPQQPLLLHSVRCSRNCVITGVSVACPHCWNLNSAWAESIYCSLLYF